VPVDQQKNYTVTFAAGGTFSAKADCNTVNGTYATPNAAAPSGDLTLTIGPGTIAFCGDESLSDLYVLALSNARSYAIANAQLTITLDDGGTLSFK
jgi:heat shock protein HslJ